MTDKWEAMERLTKDLKAAASTLGRKEARYLVDYYYQLQDRRIRDAGQIRSQQDEEPSRLLQWMLDNDSAMERDLKRALGEFAASYRVGQWLQSICGIGPVISAGLIAHLEMEPWKCVVAKKPGESCNPKHPHGGACGRRKMHTAGHFWTFAGLNPDSVWEKGKKRPWNAELKSLVAFKLGECFVKVQSNESDFYGKLFRQYKDKRAEANVRLEFTKQAANVLENKKIGKTTEAYKAYSQGMLPPAHIHAQARRWTVKLFLSHLHDVMHRDWYDTPAPEPYCFSHGLGDHRHYIGLPMEFPGEFGGKRLREMEE